MKIVDGFTFYNELDLLEARLLELAPVVDHFIVVEGTTTFTGKPKDLIFQQNKARYQPYLDKIIHVVVDLPIGDAWSAEACQRNAITQGLATVGDDYVLIVSDVDEIPYRSAVQALRTRTTFPVGLEVKLYYYNLRTQFQSPQGGGTVKALTKAQLAINPKCNDWRGSRNVPVVPYCGCHYSYFMTVETIQDKLESFSHSEYNNSYWKDPKRIIEMIQQGRDLFARDNICKFKIVDYEDDPYFLAYRPETRQFLARHFGCTAPSS